MSTLIALITLIASISWPVYAQSPSVAATQPTDEEVTLAREVVELLNAARVLEDLDSLSRHSNLDLLAYQHAHEMAERGSVTHHSYRYGVGTQTRIEMAFPNVFQFGENVAANRTPDALHVGLMGSTGHRVNRMDPTFTHLGVGVARAGAHQIYMAEIFVRVFDESPLREIAVLYTTVPAEDLPAEDPSRGEVLSDTVRIGRPDADNPEYWTQRGITAFEEKRFSDAVSNFRRSIEIDPDYEYAYFNLARAHLANERPDSALPLLERVLARRPGDVDALSSKGTALLLLQRHREAADAFRQVLEYRARDAGSWYNFGLANEMQGQLTEAERAYRQALHLQPDLAAAAAALARLSR